MINTAISHEWDLIAEERLKDRQEKKDKSYETILKPSIISKIKNNDLNYVLDVGCGSGELTKEISLFSKRIKAIDISPKSIELALKYNNSKNIEYLLSDVENFESKEEFTLAYSNMALMDIQEIKVVLQNVFHSLKNNSKFIFTITHPAFWPIYWNYQNENNFNYLENKAIIKEFKTQNKTFNGLKTRHFHRPISTYLTTAIQVGFQIKDCIELADVEKKYWYPRFLLIELEKSNA
jgi:2-polyprenyl-3-methyl-5-hydroxy-6-metoxy-1,4-benzoquinol methylase